MLEPLCGGGAGGRRVTPAEGRGRVVVVSADRRAREAGWRGTFGVKLDPGGPRAWDEAAEKLPLSPL